VRPTIFISYNSGVHQEETLAVRLQTIGAVNGFNTLLPDRFQHKSPVDRETINRIQQSDYFLIFAISNHLSKIVKQEIEIAFQHFKDPSKIMVLFNPEGSDITKSPHSEKLTLIPFNPYTETVDLAIKKIINRISVKEKSKEIKEQQNSLLAFLGIGLGLWALGSIFNED
jgi:hypothetical protein